jgi:hypothetical protein
MGCFFVVLLFLGVPAFLIPIGVKKLPIESDFVGAIASAFAALIWIFFISNLFGADLAPLAGHSSDDQLLDATTQIIGNFGCSEQFLAIPAVAWAIGQIS